MLSLWKGEESELFWMSVLHRYVVLQPEISQFKWRSCINMRWYIQSRRLLHYKIGNGNHKICISESSEHRCFCRLLLWSAILSQKIKELPPAVFNLWWNSAAEGWRWCKCWEGASGGQMSENASRNSSIFRKQYSMIFAEFVFIWPYRISR